MLIGRNERGATTFLIAGALFLLIGMAAIAVDLGAGWNERRQDQTGADLSALAGAVELGRGGSLQQAVDAALASAVTNVGPLSASDWTSCTDSESLVRTAATLGLTPATNCVSFALDFRQIRVRIPDQSTDTQFAGAVGVQELVTRAGANAMGQRLIAGTPPPFAVLDGFEAGDTACLRTSSSLSDTPPVIVGNGPGNPAGISTDPVADADPCNDSVLDLDSEFMGTLDTKIWFDSNGAVTCKSNELAYAIAAGIDHNVGRFIDTPTVGSSPGYGSGGYGPPDPREVEENCAPIPTRAPNTFRLDTGTGTGALRCGLVSTKNGCDPVPGPSGTGLTVEPRLWQGPYVQNTHQILEEQMDNKPLWDFLDIKGGGSYPPECEELNNNLTNGSWDYWDKKDKMLECLVKWKDTNYDPLFSDDIGLTPRFAFVPLLAESNMNVAAPDGPVSCLSGTTKCVHINDFVPIYIQTLYVKGKVVGATDPMCDPSGGGKVLRHDAGNEFSCGASNEEIDGLSAIVLGCGMLPSELCTGRPGNPNDPGGDPTPRIELTK